MDRDNTSGLCSGSDGCLVAIFTRSGGSSGGQKQSLAVSNDDGETWTDYPGNPVLTNPGSTAFRDPKVFWHQPTERWVMVVSARDRIQIYVSPNLIDWELASELPLGESVNGVLECPDLFELPLEGGGGETRWVLKVDANPGPIIGFSKAWYLTGTFDGRRFVPDSAALAPVEWGADFYAAQSWNGIDRDRRVWIAWMANWKYALSMPTDPWRGAMTVPREVGLVAVRGALTLTQRPAAEFDALHRSRILSAHDAPVAEGARRLAKQSPDAFDLVLEVELGGASRIQLDPRASGDQRTSVVYDGSAHQLILDRSASGASGFDRTFAVRHAAPLDLDPSTGTLALRVLVDWSSVGVFAANGTVVLTDLVFPGPASKSLALSSEGGAPRITTLTLDEMATIWSEGEERTPSIRID